MGESKDYQESLEGGFRQYWKEGKQSGLFKESIRDAEHGIGRLPVFKIEHAERNIITNPAATEEEKKRLLNLIPEKKRHKWFRSMSSSQALALTFFGNLVIYGQLDWLRDIPSDDGYPAFGAADLSPYNFSMEHEIGILNEPRPTSLDVFISGRYRIALECKLSETGFGDCSRPRLGQESPEFCKGSYSLQKKRRSRCALAEIGVRYWDYVPVLFNWPANHDYDDCPLKANYQLIRNVLAACVREDGIVSPANGHALIVYDKRNPEFTELGKGTEAFRLAQHALKDNRNLQKISWQRIITTLMRQDNRLDWLNDTIRKKYGIEADAK